MEVEECGITERLIYTQLFKEVWAAGILLKQERNLEILGS
jgi:hypothetical protein